MIRNVFVHIQIVSPLYLLQIAINFKSRIYVYFVCHNLLEVYNESVSSSKVTLTSQKIVTRWVLA